MPKRRLDESGMESSMDKESESFEAQVSFRLDEEPSARKLSPLTAVARSSSTASNWSTSSNGSMSYTRLRSGLTREQIDRDPLDFYEVIKTLGKGSMGSVKLVRKKADKIGGSARRVWDGASSSSSSLLNTSATELRSASISRRDIEYAMKSIVLSHVDNQAYIDELRNEVDILRALDHPHIVR